MKRRVSRDCVKVERVGNSWTGWGREFHKMGEAQENSWRQTWEKGARE